MGYPALTEGAAKTMSKQDVLSDLDKSYNELREALRSVNEETAGKQWYGTWNAKQILAHMIGWDEEMAGALERVARGERPVPEGVDYNDADSWNAGFAEKLASGSWQEVLQRLEAAHTRFRSALDSVTDEERFAEGKTVYRIAHNSAIDHYREHAEAIREWATA
jgi:hypothetical protein